MYAEYLVISKRPPRNFESRLPKAKLKPVIDSLRSKKLLSIKQEERTNQHRKSGHMQTYAQARCPDAYSKVNAATAHERVGSGRAGEASASK